MYKTLRVLICAAVICLGNAVQAQNIGNTPYSRFGLGELNTNLGNIRNAGMAGVGVSAGNVFQPNTANPALLYYNSTTIFDMGITGQYKTIENNRSSQRDGNASLSHLTLAVPLAKRWSSAVSLRPYSLVNYEINSPVSSLESNPQALTVSQYRGEGGVSEVYFGHGVRITKGLTVGASASYLFGNIANESSILVVDTTLAGLTNERVVYSERTRYSDFLFRAGASYRQKIFNNYNFNVGATYSMQTNLDATQKRSFERRTIVAGIEDDNISPDSSQGSVIIPASFQGGFSIDNGSNLTLGAEFHMQQWSAFRNFDGESDLADSYRVAVAGEYTPDANAINSYLKRVTYRGGVYYGNTPYVRGNTQIVDRGVTLGFTAPIGRGSLYDLYLLNAAVGLGRRGTTDAADPGLIAESYMQFSMGVTINSRWFIKRRLE